MFFQILKKNKNIFSNKRFNYVDFNANIEKGLKNVDCIMTDVWVSMGEKNIKNKKTTLKKFQVNEKIMKKAKKNAIFMHCLPAHRGQEVTANVIDGPHSVVWQGAGNRLHAQKGILHWCLSGGD